MSDDIGTLSYEQALAELDGLIARLEGGAVELDEAIACYERASRLAQRCAELLDRTEQRVLQLVVGPGGALQERPLRAEAAPPTAAPGDIVAEPSAPPGAAPARGGVPPLSAAVRARLPGAAPAPGAELFPGLAPGPRTPPERGEETVLDPDDIPF